MGRKSTYGAMLLAGWLLAMQYATAETDDYGPESCPDLVYQGLTYPFPRLAGSYLFVDGAAYPYLRVTDHLLGDSTVQLPDRSEIAVGDLLFTAGQIPLTPDGTMVEGDVEAQTRQVLANLGAVLKAGGSGPEHVVKCTVFLADMNDFARVNAIYGEVFRDAPPARSAVQVARLPFDARVEIEAVARIP